MYSLCYYIFNWAWVTLSVYKIFRRFDLFSLPSSRDWDSWWLLNLLMVGGQSPCPAEPGHIVLPFFGPFLGAPGAIAHHFHIPLLLLRIHKFFPTFRPFFTSFFTVVPKGLTTATFTNRGDQPLACRPYMARILSTTTFNLTSPYFQPHDDYSTSWWLPPPPPLRQNRPGLTHCLYIGLLQEQGLDSQFLQ